MRGAGFDVPDPSDDAIAAGIVQSPQGVDQQAFDKAAEQCSTQLGIKRQDSADQQKWARQYEQVASCIRSHGYDDYPEQQPGSLDLGPETYPRAVEPEFEKVAQDCLAEYSPETKTQTVG